MADCELRLTQGNYEVMSSKPQPAKTFVVDRATRLTITLALNNAIENNAVCRALIIT